MNALLMMSFLDAEWSEGLQIAVNASKCFWKPQRLRARSLKELQLLVEAESQDWQTQVK